MQPLTEADIAALMMEVNDPTDRIVLHCVPSRAFRVIMLRNELTFRVEQLSRQHGDKWIAISTHTGDVPWESYVPAAHAAAGAQTEFLQKMRQLKIERNHQMRAAAAGTLNAGV